MPFGISRNISSQTCLLLLNSVTVTWSLAHLAIWQAAGRGIAELRNRDLVVGTADRGTHGDNGEILSRLQSLLQSIRGSSAVTK